jgi:hypothetical protein
MNDYILLISSIEFRPDVKLTDPKNSFSLIPVKKLIWSKFNNLLIKNYKADFARTDSVFHCDDIAEKWCMKMNLTMTY